MSSMEMRYAHERQEALRASAQRARRHRSKRWATVAHLRQAVGLQMVKLGLRLARGARRPRQAASRPMRRTL